MAIQLANRVGAEVVATVGAENKIACLRQFGPQFVFNYQSPQLFGRIDGVFEFERSGHTPGETIQNSLGMKLVFLPAGQFEMSTPLAPRAFALRTPSTALSSPSDGICAMPINRFGSAAQNSSNKKLL